MKYLILGVNNRGFLNIGDYIQALASSQFLPHVDGFIQREELDQYEGDEVKVIMNGWFMQHPEHWPPTENINPLFVAFHVNDSVKDELLNDAGIAYLKKHEPIGCRDTFTMNLLQKKGIEAYFSGCMTLTLGYKYKNPEIDGKVYFVEPYIDQLHNPTYLLQSIPSMIRNLRSNLLIARKMGGGMKNFIKATLFYNVYKKKFTKATLLNAEYMVQAGGDNWPDTDAELLRNAEEIIKKYSTAALIVTQRIHCALPCLGIGTPVIYTTGVNEPKFSTCRFGGILELFNVIRCNGTHLQPDFPTYGKISKENAPKNKNYWKPFATSLKERCINFLQD